MPVLIEYTTGDNVAGTSVTDNVVVAGRPPPVEKNNAVPMLTEFLNKLVITTLFDVPQSTVNGTVSVNDDVAIEGVTVFVQISSPSVINGAVLSHGTVVVDVVAGIAPE
jgi:hypothetical protein